MNKLHSLLYFLHTFMRHQLAGILHTDYKVPLEWVKKLSQGQD